MADIVKPKTNAEARAMEDKLLKIGPCTFFGTQTILPLERLRITITVDEYYYERNEVPQDGWAIYLRLHPALGSCAYYNEAELINRYLNICKPVGDNNKSNKDILSLEISNAIITALIKKAYEAARALLTHPIAECIYESDGYHGINNIEYILLVMLGWKDRNAVYFVLGFCDRIPDGDPLLSTLFMKKDHEVRQDLCAMLTDRGWPLLVKRELYAYIHWPANPRWLGEFEKNVLQKLS